MIYLDANATSRLRPEAGAVIEQTLEKNTPRNPSSVHGLGRQARSQIQHSRRAILELAILGDVSTKQKLVFTSGSTEACNLMMLGFLGDARALVHNPASIIVSQIEHPAVLEPAQYLEEMGWKVHRIPPAPDGVVRVADVLSELDPTTALVSLMAANNETGALQPIVQLASALRAVGYRGPIVSDFTQAFGKTRLSVSELFGAGVTAVSISGHKIGAPSGVGALIINEGRTDLCFPLEPMLRGGAQEHGFRAGTENLLGILAWGEVCRGQLETLRADITRKRELRELLWEELRRSVPGIERLTLREKEGEEKILCNTLLVRFKGCRADDLVVALDLEGVAASSGSACSSGKQSVSHVLTAMGFSHEEAREFVRFSLDWDTGAMDILAAVSIVNKVTSKMRGKKLSMELARAA